MVRSSQAKIVRRQSRQDKDDVQKEIETFHDVAGNDGKEALFFISLKDRGLDLSKVVCHLRWQKKPLKKSWPDRWHLKVEAKWTPTIWMNRVQASMMRNTALDDVLIATFRRMTRIKCIVAWTKPCWHFPTRCNLQGYNMLSYTQCSQGKAILIPTPAIKQESTQASNNSQHGQSDFS